MAFIESPGTLGFSTGDANVTDVEMANDHLQALISFFNKFIELKDQDLYLAGEGYAGIYIPCLAERITQHNNDPRTMPDQYILLRGMFLGNPCTTHEECHLNPQYDHYSYKYLANHYIYSEGQYE